MGWFGFLCGTLVPSSFLQKIRARGGLGFGEREGGKLGEGVRVMERDSKVMAYSGSH